jgi:hypothetical protein
MASAWHSFRVPVFWGRHDTNIGTGEDYDTRRLFDLFQLSPESRPKDKAPAFLPSMYCDYDARCHEVQRERGKFVALTGDNDEGNHSRERIEQLVAEFVGESAWLVFTSSHARPNNMRWRIIVPLAEPVVFELWHDAQTAFFKFMEQNGVKMDRSLARSGQPVYLQNVPATHVVSGTPLRDGAGKTLYYDRASSDIDAPGLPIDTGPLAEGIADLRRCRAEDERLREQLRVQAERRRASQTPSREGSVIEAFNRSTSIADLLTRYRYTQSPRSPEDWRSPHQTSGTYATRIIGDKWVSLSGSDAAAGLGARCDSGCYGDRFDLFLHYEHGGDYKSAWKEVCEEQGRSRPLNGYNHSMPPSWEEGNTGPTPDSYGADPAADRPAISHNGAAPITGITLNDFRAYMLAHNYIFTPTGEQWPASSVNARIPAVALTNAAGAPVLDDKGKPQKISASAWLDQHRPVEQMTWAPGEPQIVEGRLISDGGWMKRPGCSVFNLYRPPVEIPGDHAQAEPWIDHVYRIYPDEAQHIIGWLAHRVQRPAEKINHALVLGGAQGIGKDTILEPVKDAIGPWNFAEVSPKQMLGRFNGYVKSVILRVNEARDLGDQTRFEFYDHMKTYTAAPPDVLRVDEKFRNEYAVFNVCGVIITTNHKTDGIYLPEDDRRHFVAWSNATRDDFEPDYWTSLYRWYREGGIGHVVAYLRQLSLADFDPKAPPTKTPAFWDIVASNQAPEEAELADALDTLAWPHAVTINSVAVAASDEFSAWLRDRKNSRAIPHKLDKAGYVAVRNSDATDGLWRVGLRRCAIYAKRDLAFRDQIAAAQRLVAGR